MAEPKAKTTKLVTSGIGGELLTRQWTAEVIEGPDRGRSVTRDSGVIIVGSHPDADLVLADTTVSRHHAELQLLPEGVTVVDLGSTNGTRVGKAKISRALLPPGATVHVGQTRILLRSTDAPAELGDRPRRFGAFLSDNPAQQQILAQLARAAKTEATILIEAPTGTGKELLAKAVHSASERAAGPFVIVDCGAIPEHLFERELFGSMQGSFTGADADHPGFFESAEGGTIFLDELGELPPAQQPKLLRALEARTIRRIGDSRDRPIDVRFIAATNRDLSALMRQGSFRSDLYYRVAVVRASVLPLRDRPEDIPLLANHFAAELGVALSGAALSALETYAWPGNARELRNTIERAAAVSAGGVLQAADLLTSPPPSEAPATTGSFHEAKDAVIQGFERAYVRALLERHQGQVTAAAREAGLSRPALYALMKRAGLPVT